MALLMYRHIGEGSAEAFCTRFLENLRCSIWKVGHSLRNTDVRKAFERIEGRVRSEAIEAKPGPFEEGSQAVAQTLPF